MSPQTTTMTAADTVTLSETDRSRRQTFVHLGRASACNRTRAQVLSPIPGALRQAPRPESHDRPFDCTA